MRPRRRCRQKLRRAGGSRRPRPPSPVVPAKRSASRDPYAAASLWAQCRTASSTTRAGGYGSLRSQGRRKSDIPIFKQPKNSRDANRARGMPRTSAPKNRGRRECRVRAAPAVSCARCTKENAHEHTGSAEAIRHSLRDGFTAYFVLSPGTGLSCPRHLADTSATLDASVRASGPHDLTSTPIFPVFLQIFSGRARIGPSS